MEVLASVILRIVGEDKWKYSHGHERRHDEQYDQSGGVQILPLFRFLVIPLDELLGLKVNRVSIHKEIFIHLPMSMKVMEINETLVKK